MVILALNTIKIWISRNFLQNLNFDFVKTKIKVEQKSSSKCHDIENPVRKQRTSVVKTFWLTANAGSAMSLSYGEQQISSCKTMESTEVPNPEYILLFFDVNRGGFFDVAQKILNYLDYKSLVMFKRTCKSIYEFNANYDIEQVSPDFWKKE